MTRIALVFLFGLVFGWPALAQNPYAGSFGGSSSLVIGTTPITGGADTQILFNNAGVVSSDAGATKAAGATGAVTFGGALNLPDTTGSTVGVINYGGARFLHDSNANSNVFLGHNSANFTHTLTNGVCVGESCMLGAVSGANNTCVGRFCMGGALNGVQNTALGSAAMSAVTSGGTNVGIGAAANAVVSASNTTCVGASSCGAATGASTTALGASAGSAVTGANNTFIGASSGTSITSTAGNTIVGQGCTGTAAEANTVELGSAGCTNRLTYGHDIASIWDFIGGTIAVPSIATDSGQTATATVCEDTTTHVFFFGSGTGGICKGTSGRQFKRDIREVSDVDLAQIIALKPSRYFNKEDKGLDATRPQVGLIADEVWAALPDCADDNTVDYLCVSVMSLNALKQLAAEVAELKRRVH